MIRGALSLVLIIIVVVALGAFFMGRRSTEVEILPDSPVEAKGPVDTDRARDVGARVGEATANAANQAQEAIATGGVTAKIKSKMALDELVKARNIDVDTDGSVVTLTGVVGSQAERTRAVQLAEQTEGVTSVVDNLRIQ